MSVNYGNINIYQIYNCVFLLLFFIVINHKDSFLHRNTWKVKCIPAASKDPIGSIKWFTKLWVHFFFSVNVSKKVTAQLKRKIAQIVWSAQKLMLLYLVWTCFSKIELVALKNLTLCQIIQGTHRKQCMHETFLKK